MLALLAEGMMSDAAEVAAWVSVVVVGIVRRVVVERDAVRVAALRTLLIGIAAPSGEPLAPIDERAAQLLLAGYSERDICAALAIEPDALRTILVRLAR